MDLLTNFTLQCFLDTVIKAEFLWLVGVTRMVKRWGGSVLVNMYGRSEHPRSRIIWRKLSHRQYGFSVDQFNVVGCECYRFGWNDAK